MTEKAIVEREVRRLNITSTDDVREAMEAVQQPRPTQE